MAEAEIARVVAAAEARWPLLGVTAIHRYGTLAPGARIVLVAVAAARRRHAFEAAEMLMDYLKTQAPFWKRARLRDGALEPWVEAEASDDRAAARWRAADRS
jgi:molybdopterin synthase catalytic subunit